MKAEDKQFLNMLEARLNEADEKCKVLRAAYGEKEAELKKLEQDNIAYKTILEIERAKVP